MIERFRGCLLGLAAGDAVGTTVEFSPPGTFKPVTDMVGGGPFGLAPGKWTDDTSMALCLAQSLIEKEGFDPNFRQMIERKSMHVQKHLELAQEPDKRRTSSDLTLEEQEQYHIISK